MKQLFCPDAGRLKRIILFALAISIAVFGGAIAIDPTLRKIVFYNCGDIDDYKIFPNRRLQASPKPFQFREAIDPSRLPRFVRIKENRKIPLNQFLQSTNTIAFLAIKDDVLIYEKYFDGRTSNSISMSFSVTKAIFSALVGIAIEEGVIRSLEQPITDYIPELADRGFKQVKLKHLLQMTSGTTYADRGLLDNPFGKQARLSYTDNIEKELLSLRLKQQPGTTFLYKSVDNALLALVLDRALSPLTISDYMQEKIWTPLGMESDALWSIDRSPDGLEKTWCCISATARDLAKFGRLYLYGGNWNGTTIVPHDWVIQSTRIDTTEGSLPHYQYGWWLMSEIYGDFRAEGVRGQFIYINPDRKIIIVRLGNDRGGLSWLEWKELLTDIAEGIT